ncbi:MAG: hypothetical protein WD826_09650 [Actinomycetota bacterium]
MNQDNLATAAIRRYFDALLAGDWNALADTIAESHRFEDRRLGLKFTLDKAGNIEQAHVIHDFGSSTIDFDLLETRGDRFALVRQTFHSDFAVTSLGVCEVDEAARIVRYVIFDEDDIETARTTLDAVAKTT